jgi:hypothetical protein
MRDNIPFHDQPALIDRLIHDHVDKRKLVFLIGSGLTCPVRDLAGVLGVKGIIDLVRHELATDQDLIKQLDGDITTNPKDEYQISFQHLGGRRPPGCASRIIRSAVLAARRTGDPSEALAARLRVEDYIRTNDCEYLCNVLEKDLANWHIRPGLSSLGTILTEYAETFGNEVITTNFDPLIEVSIQSANGRAEAWPLAGDAPSSFPRTQPDTCRIFHIHGYWSSIDTLHTKLVMESERPYLEATLANILRERVLIVMGYGGWDDALIKVLGRANQDAGAATNVLWAFYQNNAQDIYQEYGPLIERLLTGLGGTRIFFYKGIDADQLLPALLRRLQNTGNTGDRLVQSVASSSNERLSQESIATPVNCPPALEVESPAINEEPSGEPILSDCTAQFVSRLREREPDLVFVVNIADFSSDQTVQEPSFLLFKRENAVVMAVVPYQSSVDEYKLQKTSEPQIRAKLLSGEQVREVGFTDGRVHPMFTDSGRAIDRIFWDSSLLIQAILFPESKIALPLYHQNGTEQKLTAPIGSVLTDLMELHGADKLVFNALLNQAKPAKPNLALNKLLEDTAYITRFAPTPSNQLHLGNARTALATYLLGLKDKQRSQFFLRIDNTDHTRTKAHLVPIIKEEIRWLGLEWDEDSEVFEQSDEVSFHTYLNLLKILNLADLTETQADGIVFLKSLPQQDYYCVYYDWRDGAVVTHQPPLTEERNEKRIRLFRPEGDNAYYQFAGLADDIRNLSGKRHLTYVVRDNRQMFLTRVQAHIRYAIELARQLLANDPEAQRLFWDSGLDPTRSIPIPLYLHLPVVTDDGEAKRDGLRKKLLETLTPDDLVFQRTMEFYERSKKYTALHKRQQDESDILEKYTLKYLEHEWRLLPESIVSYLVATIIPPSPANENGKRHLTRVARVFSHLGVRSGLQFFAKRFTPDDLVRSQGEIRCRLDEIRFADQIVVRSLPLWKLRQKLMSQELSGDVHFLDDGLLRRIATHSAEFSGYSQILSLIQQPGTVPKLSSETMNLLTSVEGANEDETSFIPELRRRLQQIRVEIRSLPAPDRKTRLLELGRILADLRHALLGPAHSPKVEALLDILGAADSYARIKKCLGRKK